MEQVIVYIKKYKYILICLILILILIILFFVKNEDPKESLIEVSQIASVKEKEEVTTIKVNIKGAVMNPGVYEISSDSRVEDAIYEAGGLTNNADTSIINLSKKLNDESVIIIYTAEEVKSIKQGNVVVQYIENECNCPEYQNNACIDPETLINNDNSEVSAINKVSLNRATLDQLQTLPGIGKAKAEAIIDYRNVNGGFKTIEELKKVKGIGDAIFNKIKDDITI